MFPDFQLPPSMVLTDTFEISKDNEQVVDYLDTNGVDNVQITTFKTGERYIVYFKFTTNESFVYEYDSLDNLTSYGYKLGLTCISYDYYPNGQLSGYSYLKELPEEEGSKTKSFYDKRSYVIKLYPNGQLQCKYFFINESQPFVEYWEDGSVKTEGDLLVFGNFFLGKYKEYDAVGRLKVKGEYRLIQEHNLKSSVQSGTWKFYENGKLVRKEKKNYSPFMSRRV